MDQDGSSDGGEKWSNSRYITKIYLLVLIDGLDMISETERCGEETMKLQEFWLGQPAECSEFANIVGDTVNGYIQELDFGMLTLRHPSGNDLYSTSLLNNARLPCTLFHLFLLDSERNLRTLPPTF